MIAHTPRLNFSRDRLHARLDAAGTAPLTLVVAGAGAGKSTAVREYLALRRIEHVRFTSGPAHATGEAFLRGLAGALRAVAPALASSAPALAARLGQPGGQLAALAWAREHLGGLAATTIVLDDLHHALGDPHTAGFLTGLVDATVPRLRWMLIARDATTLPVPRWLADNVSDLPLDDDDLRVRFDELRAVARAAGLGLDDAALHALDERTGGWALGLAVALARGGVGDGDREQTYDGLVDTVLAPLSERERQRLVGLALTGGFDRELAQRLGYAAPELEALVASGLVHALDDRSYAVYDPYRERLARHATVGPRQRAALLERVARALDEAGRWSEALELRIEAGDGEALAGALDAHGFEALDQGNLGLVGRALAALPEAVLAGHARALCMRAALASLEERFDVAEAWFGMAVAAAAHPADRREIVIRYGVDLVRRGRTDVLGLLEAEAQREQSGSSADAALWGLLGTAYVEAHRLDEARDAARRALSSLGAVEDEGLRARICHQAAYVALNEGDYAAARELAERALASAERCYLYDVAARVLSVLFNIAILHDDDVPAGRRALAKLEEAGRKAGSTTLRIYALLNAYSIEVDGGDGAAIERLDAALRELEVHLTATASEALLPAQALRAAWDGRFEHAYELLAPGVEKLFDDDRTAYRWAEIAVYAAAAGKRAESTAAIRRSRRLVRGLDPMQRLALRARAYLALAEILLAHDGRARAALADIRGAARRAGPRFAALVAAIHALHLRWTTGWHGSPALDDALDGLAGFDLGGVARFIGALPLPSTERARLTLLSDTEQRVLTMVAAGATSKEIALELERSSQTVDVHVRTICRKLGCSGRRQAVALAQREGLVDERRRVVR